MTDGNPNPKPKLPAFFVPILETGPWQEVPLDAPLPELPESLKQLHQREREAMARWKAEHRPSPDQPPTEPAT